jgi:hypothetical protein
MVFGCFKIVRKVKSIETGDEKTKRLKIVYN